MVSLGIRLEMVSLVIRQDGYSTILAVVCKSTPHLNQLADCLHYVGGSRNLKVNGRAKLIVETMALVRAKLLI